MIDVMGRLYDSRIHFYQCWLVGCFSRYGGCRGHDCMLVGCYSRYGGGRGHDCMLVGCYFRYGGCRGNDCMLVGCFSRYGGCRSHDCMLVGCYSRYGGYHGHGYNSSLIVLFNLYHLISVHYRTIYLFYLPKSIFFSRRTWN